MTEKKKKPVITSMYWWLSKRRSFFIGDDYQVDLINIDRRNNSAKIQVTNLKTGTTVQSDGELCEPPVTTAK